MKKLILLSLLSMFLNSTSYACKIVMVDTFNQTTAAFEVAQVSNGFKISFRDNKTNTEEKTVITNVTASCKDAMPQNNIKTSDNGATFTIDQDNQLTWTIESTCTQEEQDAVNSYVFEWLYFG
jgi:hypothetical protein